MNIRFSNITNFHYKFNNIIVLITFLVIVFLTYITFLIYKSTLEETKNIHQKQQYELAKSAANGISFYLNHLTKDLSYLSKSKLDQKTLNSFYYNQAENDVIKCIFISDKTGKITNSVGREIHNIDDKLIQNLITELQESRSRNFVYSSVFPQTEIPDSNSMYFYILVKSENNSYEEVDKHFYIGYYVYFNWLMKEFVTPLKLSESDFAWILDNDGRLIYHPHHKNMLLRSIRDSSNSCKECHSSFQVQERMLVQKSSTDSYIIGDEPEKIMAYFPIDLGNTEWILAISTYLPAIISNVKNNFMLFFALYAVAVVFIISLGALFYVMNIKRIKLAESKRFLEKANAFQEKINHASKLASIGELVDSVAHEINTPTGIIATETDLILLRECDPKNCCEELAIIKSQTKRIGDYTKRLLNYSRRMPFNPQEYDIKKLIEECIFLVSPRLRAKSIEVKTKYDIDLSKVIFDWGRMEQVIVNLLNNAIDFVDKNPQIIITINTDNSRDKNDNQQNIIITVEDNGLGIPKENISSVFEPFFSTKPLSKGTGLGLSISKAIVNRHHGSIEVESKNGNGTKFVIRLPLITKIAEESMV